MDKRTISKVFLVVLLGAAVLLVRLFWTYISAIVFGLLIASAFFPLYNRLRGRLKDRTQAAALLMCLIITVILIIPVGGFVGTLSNEAFDFYKRSRTMVSVSQLDRMIHSDGVWANRIRRAAGMAGISLDVETLNQFVSSVGTNVGLFLSRQLGSLASNILSLLIHFFLMILVIFYIFRDGDRLKNYISELLPFPLSQQELMVNKFREMGRAVILANGVSGIIQGILAGFGFFFSGLGSPFLWGTIAAFMAFLPLVGASIVFIPATVILFLQGKTGMGLGFLIYNICYSAAIEYVLKPRLIGKGMRMNPLLVFIGVLGGLKLFGILGVVYGPLIMTIFLTLAEIYRLEYKEAML
ncbi:MAG: AI-2E family transporter [Thermodesulfobacteriota bacterium]